MLAGGAFGNNARRYNYKLAKFLCDLSRIALQSLDYNQICRIHHPELEKRFAE